MSDRAVVWALRVVVALGVALATSGSAFLIGGGHVGFWTTQGGPFTAVFSVFFGVLVWLVAPRQPRNTLLWVMVTSTFFFGLFVASGAVAASLVDPAVLVAEPTIPADLPTGAAWFMALHSVAWVPAMFGLLTLGLLLFPDGTLPSPRWRLVALLAIAVMSFGLLGGIWTYRPTSTVRYAAGISEDPAALVMVLVGLVAAASSLVALIGRFRRSRGETRQQFRWVAWGASFIVPAFALAFPLQETPYRSFSEALFYAGGGALLASYGIAVGKYRLYDIDVVISRTVVYGTLAVFITGAYVGVVVGLGDLLGADQSSPLLAVGATALVAFAFEPLRRRLQRLANRLVYGTRATPYEVLSDFSRQIAVTDLGLLGQVARSLAEGTTASAAAVWVVDDGALSRAAVWPPVEGDLPPAAVSDPAQIPAVEGATSVVHNGELLGALTLSAARGQSLLPADHQLLGQVASGLGLALRNLRLADDLRRQVDELRRSRQRIVAVQDETRRRLERDLHDGAQQRLVAIKVKLGLARQQAKLANLSEVMALLDRVAAETDVAIDSLRDFARGIYPPLLEAEGLGSALVSQVQKLAIPITVHAAGVGRHPAAVEAAVYFCVLEALNNVVKHAEAASAHVALHQTDDTLAFEVSDDGKGFDPESIDAGSGLTSLSDRLDALDGTLEVVSAPGQGTTIRGVIPSRVKERVP